MRPPDREMPAHRGVPAGRGGIAHRAALLAREWPRVLVDEPAERMLCLLADGSAELLSRNARLLAVDESVRPADQVLHAVRERGRAATHSDLLELARAIKRAG